ncbi:M1 family metallopeptidase [Lutimonas sp.]|uniref:M1 family metallopeptidase n=1 Tax=Lutimonas sp. TaxID=1872403 RepID=UPI003D9B98B7
MNFKVIPCLLIVFLFSAVVYAQDSYKRNSSANVQHYEFNLQLNDKNNEIKGESTIYVNFENGIDTFSLDLIKNQGDFGMRLKEVLENGEKANYDYSNDKIHITPSQQGDQTREYTIKYAGIPEKGLVIDTTKYGQRSFFGDNWPNLARYWLACVDHPYDKASVEFKIIAPDHYDVVATGKKIEESSLGNDLKMTRYFEPAPVATKVMTIGVTRFAASYLGTVEGIDISAWVYPENRQEGFTDFEEATKIMEYFISQIGPYSYAKLANMQAKTKWGGLENAGTISYKETSITGNKEIQGLMAHEIAHQWFGNSATEDNWNHVWLSEGFATYFTILYQEEVDGNEKRKEELQKDQIEIFEYYLKNPSPIIDLTITDPKKVLSRNTYQKGSWVLNMLRHRIGDEAFWDGIRTYYKKYQNANVLSEDFQQEMENASGDDLEEFFNQWLYIKGYPELKWLWKYHNGKLTISVKQVQKHHVFKFPIEFGIVSDDEMEIKKVMVSEKSSKFEIELEGKPDSVVIDPETWLLFQEK